MNDRIDILARILACGPHMQDVHDAVEELMEAAQHAHDILSWDDDFSLEEEDLWRALDRVRPLNMVSNEEGS